MKRLLRLLVPVASALLLTTAAAAVEVIDLDWKDTARERKLPLKVRVPDGNGAVPLVIFSHGLGGSREGGKAWGEYWSQHGYLVLHLQHVGSDESVWRGNAEGTLRQRLARGATAEQMLGRVDDVRFVIDELTRLQKQPDAARWIMRANLASIAVTGHSFGARTTMALAGERFPGPIKSLADPRITAFIAFSPTTQGLKRSWPERYGEMARPFMSVTGTIDGDVMGVGSTAKNRAAVFDVQPPGDKFRVLYDDGDHSVFGGGDIRDALWLGAVTGDHEGRTPPATARRIQQSAQQLTLRFLDAYLKNDAAARAWLANDAEKAVAGFATFSRK